MHKFYTGLVIVAAATVSFAIGRSTSGPVPDGAPTTEIVASIDVHKMHLASGYLPVLQIDSPF